MDNVFELDESAGKDTDVANEITSDEPEQNTEDVNDATGTESDEYPDYEAIIARDISELASEFAELKDLKDITELNNPLRYAELRDLGLTPREAYLATAKRYKQDNRAHLRTAHGKNARASLGSMSNEELSVARELFPDLSDSDLQKLYKKVTK